MPNEKLPTGFTRRESGSLRVQIRLKGHQPVVKNFELVANGAAERKRQLAEAEAWAIETRRRMLAGAHVSSREAERTTLADALRRYEAEGLSGEEANLQVERYRIQIILKDPIAQRPVAFFREKDVAAFRDRLVKGGWRKKVDAAVLRLTKEGAPKKRLEEVKGLVRRKETVGAEQDMEERRRIEAEIAKVEGREGIKGPARTTIVNVVQLISRSLNHVRQTMDSVPEIRSVRMPKASPGRERRPTPAEMERMLREAPSINPAFPLLIRFAVTTTLRRGRALSCRLADIRPIGSGKHAIAFPRENAVRNKRTGVVPVTSELRGIIDEACALKGLDPMSRGPEAIFDVSASQLVEWWDRLLARCEISDLHWHDLRHEGTSRLFERDLTTAEVMSITGHSTQEMVDRYSHYIAAIMHAKLERESDVAALLAEIEFLVPQYVAAGGDIGMLRSAMTPGIVTA